MVSHTEYFEVGCDTRVGDAIDSTVISTQDDTTTGRNTCSSIVVYVKPVDSSVPPFLPSFLSVVVLPYISNRSKSRLHVDKGDPVTSRASRLLNSDPHVLRGAILP